ncbi:MAG: hypothetical protein ACNA8H_01295, partial [Anaerolineales bacterium]
MNFLGMLFKRWNFLTLNIRAGGQRTSVQIRIADCGFRNGKRQKTGEERQKTGDGRRERQFELAILKFEMFFNRQT